MLLAFVILYLLLTLVVGAWAARKVKTSGDFLLAGRSLPVFLSTSALFATWFGSETVFGASSEFLRGGLLAVIEDPFGAALCLFLFGAFFARKMYRMNLLTMGDFFRVRYGRRTELMAAVFMVPSYFGYAAGQLVAMGLILTIVAGIPLWVGVVLSAVVVTAYTFVGGMWAISVTDFVQSAVIIAGLLVLASVLASKAGGAATILREVPPENFRFLPASDSKAWIAYLAAWSVLGLGSIPSQDVYQRVMSSGSEKVAVYSCYFAGILYLTVAMLPLFISLCVKHLYPNEINGDTQLVLPAMVVAHTSMGVQILFFGSLLSAILSTTSSAILAPAAILSENIIKPLSRITPGDQQLLLWTRISVVLIAAISTVFACWRSNIYELVGEASVFSLVSLFVPLTFGLYWRRATAAGALSAMVVGMVTWVYFENFPLDMPALVPALLASLVAMLVGSYFKKETYLVAYDQNRT